MGFKVSHFQNPFSNVCKDSVIFMKPHQNLVKYLKLLHMDKFVSDVLITLCCKMTASCESIGRKKISKNNKDQEFLFLIYFRVHIKKP